MKIWPILFLLVALGCRNAKPTQKKSLVLTPGALDLPDGLSQAEWENTLGVATPPSGGRIELNAYNRDICQIE